jgi:hypothetical protein
MISGQQGESMHEPLKIYVEGGPWKQLKFGELINDQGLMIRNWNLIDLSARHFNVIFEIRYNLTKSLKARII